MDKLTWNIQRAQVQKELQPLRNVKNIIAVLSGKGGVGKSTVALHLARALTLLGAATGILDADIYGPSIPIMLGTKRKPEITNNKEFLPIIIENLQVMSFGFLLDDEAPAIWRGPMVSQALKQMLFNTKWDNLDFLIVDMPPGTGDIQLTMAQSMPVAGAIVVSTPQKVATADCRKAILMLQKVGINILGLVENMSYFTCSHCEAHDYLLGQDGGRQLAHEMEVPFLAAMPFLKDICYSADAGQHHVLDMYTELAFKVANILNNCNKASNINVRIKVEE